jgi:type I restriction enzyme S subunit
MTLILDRSTWKHVRLGDVVRRSHNQVAPADGGVEAYVAGGHIDTDTVIIDRSGDPSDGQMGSTFRYVFEPGQVLFVSARPYLRKVGVPAFAGVVADKTYVLSAVPENGLLHDLMPFLLISDSFIDYANQEATGSMNPRLLWGAMQRYEFDLPPLDEQKRIAELLWSVERCHQAVESLLRRSDAVSRQLRDEFMRSSRRTVQAAEAFGITIGRQRAPKYQAGDHMVPYLRSANVMRAGVELNDLKLMNFTPDEQAKFALKPGDVLVSEGSASATAVGMPAVWNGELPGAVCFQNTLLRYRAVAGVTLPGFVEQWCRWAFETGEFHRVSSGTNIHHIGSRGALGMDLHIPSLDDQASFLVRVSATEVSALAASAETAEIKALRSTLLADVFGGN